MGIRHITAGLATLALLCPLSAAQGADDCSSAQPINGLGTFSFDNTAATIDGPLDCTGAPVRKDVWFRWTAPSSGGFRVSLCGGTSLLTRIAVYDGVDCVNYPQIGCVADVCNGQSRISFAAISGNEYLIRMGSRQFGTSGSGTFEITTDQCPLQGDDAFEDNDLCTSAVTLGNGTFSGLTVSKSDLDWYAFPVANGGSLTIDVLFSHALGDLDIFLVESCTGSVLVTGGSGDDNEQVLWDNTLGCDTTVFLRVEHWAPDPTADCNTYDMVVSGSGGPGTGCDPTVPFCDPANPNSTGQPAVMTASGSFDTAGGGSPVHFEVTGGPPTFAGYFLVSTGASGSVTISDGILCLDSPQGRYNPAAGGPFNSVGIFDASGVLQNAAGTSTIGSGYDVPLTLTNPPGGTITAGSTYYFQLWYRDFNPGSVSNFTNGLAVTFN